MAVAPERVIAEVASLLDRNRANQAMSQLAELIDGLGPERLQLLSPDLRGLIDRFYRKKKRDLQRRLETRLGRDTATDSLESVSADYANRLDSLREGHIYQWNTHYRETIDYILKDLLRHTPLADSPEKLLLAASSEFERHSTDIFLQGFRYITQQHDLSDPVAQLKSANGLQSFLLLLVQAHTTLRGSVRHSSDARALRNACSALLTGVLRGYAQVCFGNRSGWSLLQSTLPLWAHTLAFLPWLRSGEVYRLDE